MSGNCLAALPDEVLAIIWEYVRVALRPRMKRAGWLLRDIRVCAGTRIAAIYGKWLFTHATISTSVRLSLQDAIYCIWRLYGLPHMCTIRSHQDGKSVFWEERPLSSSVTVTGEAHMKTIWERVPEAVWLPEPYPRIFVPPLPWEWE